jgi:hypothetical protein
MGLVFCDFCRHVSPVCVACKQDLSEKANIICASGRHRHIMCRSEEHGGDLKAEIVK